MTESKEKTMCLRCDEFFEAGKKKGREELLEELKEKRFWKEGDTTYIIDSYEYPHDEKCEGTACWCANRAKKSNPEKWEAYIKEVKK